jgi:hypothetical protein
MSKLDADNFALAGASIKNFAISLSTRVETDFGRIVAARKQLQGADRAFHDAFGSSTGLYQDDDPPAIAEENYPGVAQLLKQMPNLEALDLHLRNALKGMAKSYDQVFAAIAHDVHLPSLEQCILRGLITNEESLLQFLQKHPQITQLDLREINLTSGSWDSIFKHLSESPALKSLRLSSLWAENLVNLAPKDGGYDQSEHRKRYWSFPCFGGEMVHTREFSHDELRTALKFAPRPSGRQLGSYYVMHWMNSKEALYGPP